MTRAWIGASQVGKAPGIMLDQEGGEALMGAQRRAVDDIDRMVRAVLADIFQVEGLGRQEIELVGGDGVFGADRAT